MALGKVLLSFVSLNYNGAFGAKRQETKSINKMGIMISVRQNEVGMLSQFCSLNKVVFHLVGKGKSNCGKEFEACHIHLSHRDNHSE